MDVTSIATSGLRAAEIQVSNAAQNIASASAIGYQQQNVTQTEAPDGGVQSQVSGSDQDVDTAQQLVSADIATYDFQANLMVLKTQQQMQKSLLDIQA